MAVLWQETGRREWACLVLESVAVPITQPVGEPAVASTLVPFGAARPARWILLAGDHDRITVNGLPVLQGARVLTDRDEIRTATHRFFFSSESLARSANHLGEPTPCPRCKLLIETSQAAVICPTCGVAHHQTDELPCWDYAPRCAAGCSQSTELEGGFRWTPEDE